MGRKRRFQAFTSNLKIEKASNDGRSIGRWEGKVVFVENAVPGDEGEVYIFKQAKGILHGKLDQLTKASSLRTEPKCGHFSLCGGCKWQYMNYEAQLEMKASQVEEDIRRIGKIPIGEIKPILGNDKIFYYRNKLEFSFSNKTWLKKEDLNRDDIDQRALGYHLPRFFDKVLPIEECLLQKPIINDIRNAVLKFSREKDYSFYDYRANTGFLRNLAFRTSDDSGEIMINLIVGEDKSDWVEEIFQHLENKFPQITSFIWVVNEKVNNVYTDLPFRVWKGPAFITEKLGKYQFKISPISFFQTNPGQANALYQLVFDHLQSVLPEGKEKHRIVYDLYSGTGSIGIFVSELAEKIVGIEYVEQATIDAEENVRINGLDQFRFYAGDMKRILSDELINREGQPDVIITDPPRQGMDPKVVSRILKLAPKHIIYVSCKPATQARDMSLLAEKYDLVSIQPVDMFPHTAHVENVALLSRKSIDGSD